jgi:hypothetical protein
MSVLFPCFYPRRKKIAQSDAGGVVFFEAPPLSLLMKGVRYKINFRDNGVLNRKEERSL